MLSDSTAVRVRVPASSANLGPGFDCLGLAFQLYNYVSIGASATGQHQITASGEGAESLGDIESNIAFIAVQHLSKALKKDFGPLHLHLENGIPFARGLGSSSAARVGALVAANEWARRNFEKSVGHEEILNLATELEGHPDNVAAALLGGLTVSILEKPVAFSARFASPNPEKTDKPFYWLRQTTPAQCSIAKRFPVQAWPRFIVFIPDEQLETKTARGILPAQIPHEDAVFNLGRTALLLSAFATDDYSLLSAALNDRLHQPQRAHLIPAFQGFSATALQNGASGMTLSGAGPTMLFWLTPDAEVSKVLSALQSVAQAAKVPGRAIELQVDLDGCVVVESD